MSNTPTPDAMVPTEAGPPSPQSPPEPPEGDDVSLLDLALVVAENLRLLILGPLVVGLVALGISFAVTPTFTAKSLIMPPFQSQSAAAAALQSIGALAGVSTGVRNPSDQYVALMQSTTVEDRIVERFKLMELYEVKYKAQARKRLEELSRITSSRKDNLISVEVDDEDPQRAADLANAYVEELKRLTTEVAVSEAQQRRVFFEEQLKLTSKKFDAAQRALQAAGINEGAAIRANPGAAAGRFAQLRAEITTTELRIQAMRAYLAESSPEVRLAQNQLQALRGQLAQYERADPAVSQGDYFERAREFRYQEALYDLLVRQLEAARLDESREGAVIQVIDVAKPPERKSKPKKALIAVVATLAAGFALLLWVFVRHALRNARQDAASAQKLGMLSAALRRSVGRKA